MTDFGVTADFLPARLGVTGRFEDGRLFMDAVPMPETLSHGVLRASVLAYAVDSVAGIVVDDDPDSWSMTSDLSLRMLAQPARERITASATVVRRGRRSSSCTVDLVDHEGTPAGSGVASFVRYPRRDGDPSKPDITPQRIPSIMGHLIPLDRPLREAAGIEVLDAPGGIVQVEVTPELRNPAGTLQGAMVALVAESAAEELIQSRFSVPAVVTDLDVRYLAQAPAGPVRTRCEVTGDGPDASVLVELTDITQDVVTTLAYARATPLG